MTNNSQFKPSAETEPRRILLHSGEAETCKVRDFGVHYLRLVCIIGEGHVDISDQAPEIPFCEGQIITSIPEEATVHAGKSDLVFTVQQLAC